MENNKIEDYKATESNNVLKAVDALKLTERSFKERMKERGIADKLSPGFNDFRKEYNAAGYLVLELVQKGMNGGKGKAMIHYANPDKHRSRQSADVKPDSRLYKAMEFIREERSALFLKSKHQSLLPHEVDLTPDQWCKIALALHAVPHKYKVATDSGNMVHNASTAKAYIGDFEMDILNSRIEASDTAAEQVKEETTKLTRKTKAA